MSPEECGGGSFVMRTPTTLAGQDLHLLDLQANLYRLLTFAFHLLSSCVCVVAKGRAADCIFAQLFVKYGKGSSSQI